MRRDATGLKRPSHTRSGAASRRINGRNLHVAREIFARKESAFPPRDKVRKKLPSRISLAPATARGRLTNAIAITFVK